MKHGWKYSPYRIVREGTRHFGVGTCEECGFEVKIGLSKNLPRNVMMEKFAQKGLFPSHNIPTKKAKFRTGEYPPFICKSCEDKRKQKNVAIQKPQKEETMTTFPQGKDLVVYMSITSPAARSVYHRVNFALDRDEWEKMGSPKFARILIGENGHTIKDTSKLIIQFTSEGNGKSVPGYRTLAIGDYDYGKTLNRKVRFTTSARYLPIKDVTCLCGATPIKGTLSYSMGNKYRQFVSNDNFVGIKNSLMQRKRGVPKTGLKPVSAVGKFVQVEQTRKKNYMSQTDHSYSLEDGRVICDMLEGWVKWMRGRGFQVSLSVDPNNPDKINIKAYMDL